MEASNYFTCIAYDTVDFLIQSKYVVFGIYLDVKNDVKSIVFNNETLPHIHIGALLEKEFLCSSRENCNVVLVMRIQDFSAGMRKLIESYTKTSVPLSGNIALSVNSAISSKNIDISSLRLIPKSIRAAQDECGVCAIGFAADKKDKNIVRKRILISPDKLLKKFFSIGLMEKMEGKNESHSRG